MTRSQTMRIGSKLRNVVETCRLGCTTPPLTGRVLIALLHGRFHHSMSHLSMFRGYIIHDSISLMRFNTQISTNWRWWCHNTRLLMCHWVTSTTCSCTNTLTCMNVYRNMHFHPQSNDIKANIWLVCVVLCVDRRVNIHRENPVWKHRPRGILCWFKPASPQD